MDGIVEMHAEILARTGGTPGILNLGAVESALERCKWGPFDGDLDLPARAALLLRGICQDHPFANGNKRTALVAARQFLLPNGARLEAAATEGVDFMLAVAQGQLDMAGIADWLRARLDRV